MSAEQKIRATLADNAYRFQHEGPEVVRWLTGGSLPDAYVTFHQAGNKIDVRCATCKASIGWIPSDRDADLTAKHLADIRLAGHTHQSQ